MTTAETIFAVIQVFVGIVITAAVPWAFIIERRLAHIEAKISNKEIEHNVANVQKKQTRDSDVIRDHEGRIMKLEIYMAEHCSKPSHFPMPKKKDL